MPAEYLDADNHSPAIADHEASQHDEQRTDSERLVAYFFIPMPFPLGLPQHWTCKFTARSALSEADDVLSVGRFANLTCSLVVHLVQEPIETNQVLSALEAASAAFGFAHQRIDPPERSRDFNHIRTVLEIFVPVAGTEMAELQSALKEALSHINEIVRRYYVATQRAFPRVLLRHLPIIIPVGIRKIVRGEENPAWPSRSDMMLFLNRDSDHLRQTFDSTPVIDPESLVQSLALPSFGPFELLSDIRRDMMLAITSESPISSAIFLGASAEVLLREILAMLLWEEGRAPEFACAKLLRQHEIRPIVGTELASRLKGHWSFTGNTIITAWQKDIAYLRNKTVHSGYFPTTAEIDTARSVYESLERFIGDRLAAEIRTYPLTAREFLGSTGLERRKVLGTLAKRLRDDIHPSNVRLSFSRWRREALRALKSGPHEGAVQRSVPTLVLYADGREQWWLIDEDAELSCLAREPALGANQLASFESVRHELASFDGERTHVSIRLEGNAESLEPEPQWFPTSEVIPLNQYYRFPSSVLPPATAARPR